MNLINLLPKRIAIGFDSSLNNQEKEINKILKMAKKNLNLLSTSNSVNWELHQGLKNLFNEEILKYSGKYKNYFIKKFKKIESNEDIVSNYSHFNYNMS